MKRKAIALAILAAVTALAAVRADAAKPRVVKVRVGADSEARGYEVTKAFDGNPASMWHTIWGAGETGHPHDMDIDLGAVFELKGFRYTPRPGGGNGTIKEYEFYLGESKKKLGKPVVKGRFERQSSENVVTFPEPKKGRYVRLRALSETGGRAWTSVAEFRLMCDGVRFTVDGTMTAGGGATKQDVPQDELGSQYAALVKDIRNRGHFAKVAHETYRPEALISKSDRDPLDVVLRRTASLVEHIRGMEGAPDLGALGRELEALREGAADADPSDGDARYKLYEKACTLRRRISFANPLLDFDKILFIKRHRSKFNHMCDQYYGANTPPGGGIHVLSDPFGEEPKERDGLADSVVERGRLKGTRLDSGSFLSPDLSYDGKTIMFAYVECTGSTRHIRHTDHSRGHWERGRCYHIFKVNVDGTGLEQLTDGTFNDFDPCWLPNGRVIFITERRGGYLRCGRQCPTYTLYDMKPDGSDILCVSPHETNEWNPSVSHDGMVMYTRWDYVDRHGCVTHLPWVTTPDGRDARAVHGNFAPREKRPDMELEIRSIPGSRKFTATAAPHHGQAFGSLVMFDPRIEDDDGMGPVKRLTPEVGFPESQGGAQVYATAWALSEDFYLCVYDASMRPGAGRQGRGHIRGNYGIYLVDAFGNRELIYRDPAIACLSPMPLRARKRPRIVPEASQRLAKKKPTESTLGLMNVYDSLKPWPEGTKIKSLRVYQIIPMSVPSGGPPHEIGMRLPGAEGSDSVILARYVLGTVPVEEDGSAHFTVPAMKELFFQALDEDGLAVQSMRSSTYLQPGERLVCQGCHEPRHRAPSTKMKVATAMRRAPSVPKPDVDGTNPFSYPRLVQPVLEKHCLPCHQKPENRKKAPRLDREVTRKGRQKWYASYHSLAPKYGFWRYGDRHRTTPGRFGARAAKLYKMLKEGHNKVKLPPEDLHRITLWLDSTSIFYGVYEKEGGEAQLRGEIARPTLE
ncbi:MAG: HzsA-related protein [Planctomycetota bacterium]